MKSYNYRHKYLIFRQLLVIMVMAGTLLAQSGSSITLESVNVEGNTTTSADLIRFTAGLKQGQIIKPGDFSRGVKQLWQMGLFSNIQIVVDEENVDGVSITIQVVENPVLASVNYKGNKKIGDNKLKEVIALYPGQRITPNLLTEARNKILKEYYDDGFLLATVNAELTDADPVPTAVDADLATERKAVRFIINEGKKVRIKRITFEGNKNYSDFKLRRVLKETKQQRWYLFWRSHFDKKKFEDDKQKLVKFYRNRGYRDIAVIEDTVKYVSSKKRMNVHITVNEGPKYHFRRFSLEGNTLFSDNELRSAFNLLPGDVYDEEEFNKALYERMQSMYMDRGYIYSNITPDITPVGKDSLDVHFSIVENHKVFVRNIYISGNDRTRENVIRRELTIFPGDVFNRQRLIRSQRDIWLLNYFGNVVPDVIPVDEDEVDLDIAVEERSSDRASLNVGFTGEYGMTGGGSLEFTNFRGLGQRLVLSVNTGTNFSIYNTNPTKYHSFSLSFTDPMVFDTPNLVGASIFYSFRGASNQSYYPLEFTIKGGSANWGRRLRWPDNYFRTSWGLQVTKKSYDGSEEDLETYIGGLTETVGIKLTQVISRDSRDRPEFPTLGSRMTWETSLSGWLLGGNEDFHKHVLNLEWYTPTFDKFVLMSSFKIGVIGRLPSEGDEVSIVPLDEKFILGGNGIPYGNMLRGYPDNSIGPRSSTGSPTGGNTLLKLSAELRYPFSQNPVIYGALFAEMGNVWNSHDMLEPFYLERTGPLTFKRSAGAGIRFFMPMIGMLGFDIGYGFDDVTGDGKPVGWKTTITFGQQF